MPTASRLFLSIAALLVAGCVATAGIGFSSMAEPQSVDGWTYGFWTLASLIVASPLWLPATVPSRQPVLSSVVRRVSAVALLLPTLLFARMLREQLDRGLPWLVATWHPVAVTAVVLTGVCVVALWLLLLPDVRRAIAPGHR